MSQRVDRPNSHLDAAMRRTVLTVTVVRKPWISLETLEPADRKRQCKSTRLQSEEKMAVYRRICNRVRRSARRDKISGSANNAWQLRHQPCTENKSTQLYELAKKVKGRSSQTRLSAIKERNGNALYGKDEVMGAMD